MAKTVMSEFDDRVAQAQKEILMAMVVENAGMPLGAFIESLEEPVRDLFLEISLVQIVKAHLDSSGTLQPEGAPAAAAAPPAPEPRRRKKAPTNGARKPKAKKAAKKKAKTKAKRKAKAKAKGNEAKPGAIQDRQGKNGVPKGAAPAVSTELIDAKVLQCLRDNPDAKKDLVKTKTGFSDSQFRTSTRRLLEAGKIHRSGTTRGATYTAA